MSDPLLENTFWENVSPEPNGGCWLWVGEFALDVPILRICGKQCSAAGVAWTTFAELPLPVEGELTSACGETACVNPAHLRSRPVGRRASASAH